MIDNKNNISEEVRIELIKKAQLETLDLALSNVIKIKISEVLVFARSAVEEINVIKNKDKTGYEASSYLRKTSEILKRLEDINAI